MGGDSASTATNIVEVVTTEADRRTAATFRAEVDAAVRRYLEGRVGSNGHGAAAPLVIDLRRMTFMDSSGIRILIEAERAVAAAGGRLHVMTVRGAVRRALEVSGMLDRLDGVAP